MERPLPSSVDAEGSILGAILLDNNATNATLEKKLTPEEFHHEHNRKIFRHMLGMWATGTPIDLVTLTDQLHSAGELESSGGAAYISQLMDGVPHVTNVEHYVRIVKEKSLLRGLI
jgi:replicative DNA helicase